MATAPDVAVPGIGAENQPPTDIWRENLNTHLICPDCKQFPPDLIEENAETICANCGMILADRLVSYESEWRTFNSDEGRGDDPNRVGDADNELLGANQLATQIGGGGPGVSKESRKLKKIQAAQTADKNNKALQSAYTQIDAWAERAELNAQVKNAAKHYYKSVDDAKAFKGKSLDVVLAGCLFIACRQCKTPRSFSEIFGLTSVPKKEIGRVYKNLEKFLTSSANEQIKTIETEGGIVNRESVEYVGTQSTKPADLCARYCNMLGLDFRVQSVSQALAEKISTISTLAGRSPLSNAAACIYFASHLLGRGKSSKEISEVAHVSDATIKHAYKFLLAEKEKLVSQEWLGPQPQPRDFTGATAGPMIGDVKNLPNS